MLALAPPSPRASRRRSRRTLRRLSGSFLRRATPCEVAGPAALAAAMDLALSGALPVSGWVALSCQACYMAPGDCLAAGGWLGTLPKLHRRPGGSSRPAPRDRLVGASRAGTNFSREYIQIPQ